MAKTARNRRNRRTKSNRRTQKHQKGGAKKGGAKKGGAKKGGSKKVGGKKQVNKYFQLMMNAKKNNLESFEYNNKTYKRHSKGHLTFYKA
tara:strand:- start:430 stop:699 length:270 start_codon:yes stop_codon:yes gene_type:complete